MYRFGCDYSADGNAPFEVSGETRAWYTSCFRPPCVYAPDVTITSATASSLSGNGTPYYSVGAGGVAGDAKREFHSPGGGDYASNSSSSGSARLQFERLNDLLQKHPDVRLTSWQPASRYSAMLAMVRSGENVEKSGDFEKLLVQMTADAIRQVVLKKRGEAQNLLRNRHERDEQELRERGGYTVGRV